MILSKKSISRRWFFNTLGIIIILLVLCITILSFSVQSSIYGGIQQILLGRSDELINVLSTSAGSDFLTVSRAYIENFPDKNDMEIMSVSKDGDILVTSTGFAPNQEQIMPDYENAISSTSDFGYFIGEIESGEKVMAITRVVRNNSGGIEGSVRYLVSMTEADSQIGFFVLVFITVGLMITLFISLSGIYFIRSILTPVREINLTAQKISGGDFGVRIEKTHEDEIGELIDTINLMAEELGNSEKMKNDFISSVSHEIRTPLTAINGWAETLQETEQDKETQKRGMAVITKESKRLSGIVEELLDFSRLQNGRISLTLIKTDLLQELDEAVFLFTERAKLENKDLIYEEGTALSPIMGDTNKLRQVFVNIIDNALKYTGNGGTIKVQTRESKNFVSVIVEDSGCGIPQEHLPHVKKKFYKANQIVRGSGIGLAVADEIIKMHGGSLKVESEHGRGTKVTISIPILNQNILSEKKDVINE